MSYTQNVICNVSTILHAELTIKKKLSKYDQLFLFRYEAIMHEKSMTCRKHGQPGLPFWYLYAATIIKLLQVWNAAGNFLIYYFMGTSFRQSFHALFKSC